MNFYPLQTCLPFFVSNIRLLVHAICHFGQTYRRDQLLSNAFSPPALPHLWGCQRERHHKTRQNTVAAVALAFLGRWNQCEVCHKNIFRPIDKGCFMLVLSTKSIEISCHLSVNKNMSTLSHSEPQSVQSPWSALKLAATGNCFLGLIRLCSERLVGCWWIDARNYRTCLTCDVHERSCSLTLSCRGLTHKAASLTWLQTPMFVHFQKWVKQILGKSLILRCFYQWHSECLGAKRPIDRSSPSVHCRSNSSRLLRWCSFPQPARDGTQMEIKTGSSPIVQVFLFENRAFPMVSNGYIGWSMTAGMPLTRCFFSWLQHVTPLPI